MKGLHYIVTESGVQQHDAQIEGLKIPIAVFCDAVSLKDANQPANHQASAAVKSLVEKWITQRLSTLNRGEITEANLTQAFQYAHQRLLQSETMRANRVAVSAIVVAPLGLENPPKDLLVAGVGDCSLYRIKGESVESIFADPKNSTVGSDRSVLGRLSALKNAIGLTDSLRVYCRRMQNCEGTGYALVSYGFDNQSCDEEIQAIGANPATALDPLVGSLSKKEDLGHMLSVLTVSFDPTTKSSVTEDVVQMAPAAAAPEVSLPPRRLRHRQRNIALGLSIATCALVTALTSMILVDRNDNAQITDADVMPYPMLAHHGSAEATADAKSIALALREQNRLQGKKIEALRKELYDKSHHLQNLEQKISSIHNEADASQKEIAAQPQEETVAQIKELNSSISRLHEELAAKEHRIALLEGTITSLEEIMKQHTERAPVDAVAKAQAEARIEEGLQARAETIAESKAQALFKAHSEGVAQGQWEELNKIRSLEEAHAKLQAEVEFHIKASDEATAQIEQLTSCYLEQDKKSQEQEQALTASNDQLKEMLAAYSQEKKLCASLEGSLKQLKAELADKEQVIALAQQQTAGAINHQQMLAADKLHLIEEKDELMTIVSSLEEFQEKFVEEHKLRVSREELFQQLSASLKEQKEMLGMIDTSRLELLSELEETRRNYDQLLTQIRNQKPGQQSAIETVATTTHTPTPKTKRTTLSSATEPATAAATVASHATSPASETTAAADFGSSSKRVHLVAQGDTLSSIATRYYGKSNRWNDIFEANKRVIPDKNRIKVGTPLVIP